jgi:hypothetical protein
MNIEKMKEKLNTMEKSLADWKNKLVEAQNQVQLHNGYVQALKDLLEEIEEETKEE